MLLGVVAIFFLFFFQIFFFFFSAILSRSLPFFYIHWTLHIGSSNPTESSLSKDIEKERQTSILWIVYEVLSRTWFGIARLPVNHLVYWLVRPLAHSFACFRSIIKCHPNRLKSKYKYGTFALISLGMCGFIRRKVWEWLLVFFL